MASLFVSGADVYTNFEEAHVLLLAAMERASNRTKSATMGI